MQVMFYRGGRERVEVVREKQPQLYNKCNLIGHEIQQ